jgi:hypothetical protein
VDVFDRVERLRGAQRASLHTDARRASVSFAGSLANNTDCIDGQLAVSQER